MNALLAKLHRSLTLRSLSRRLSGQADAQAPYRPVPSRLLYVAASCLPYHISGYTTRTHEVLSALKAAGADLRVLTRAGYPWDRADRLGEPARESTLVDGILYEHERQPRNNCFTAVYASRAAKVIARYARRHRVARVHAASNHVNALPALIAACRLGIPFQYEMRGLWELTRASRMPEFEHSHQYRLGLELEGLVASHADRVFVISEQLGRYAQTRWGIAPQRLRLLPNCVDGERIKPDPETEVVPGSIGYAGSLIGYEGLDTLIEAAERLIRQGKDIRLQIIGDGEARAGLEALANSLGLQSHIRFFGRLAPEEARACLGACALVCIPRKPFEVCKVVPPIKLAEALALSKAVVVPDLPVFHDELGPQPAGWLFRSGDAENLADTLARALENPARLAEKGAQARHWVLERRQWRHFTDSITAALQGDAL